MIDIQTEKTRYNAELECAIRSAHKERGFDFTEKEWSEFGNAGYDKLDVAKLCCEHAVLADVNCYERYVIVAWNDGPREELVQALLAERYEQWVDVDRYPEAEPFCCEEWMIDGLTGFSGSQFSYIYGDYEDE